MFNTDLVGMDEQTSGRDAIALAQRLVSPSGRLIIAHVHPELTLYAKGDNGEYVAVEQKLGVDLLESVSQQLGSTVDIRYTGDDRIGAGLHRMVEHNQADLLVLGSSFGGSSGRVLLRPEMRHAVNGMPCAVAVAPTGYAEVDKPIAEIGVAYNGSGESRAALETTRDLAQQLGASAHVFEALSVPKYELVPAGWDTPVESILERCRVTRDKLAKETGLRATVASGDAVEQFTFFSTLVDLLVVGSRDYGAFGRLVHGSTTQKMLRNARSPLLILTRAARSTGSEPAQVPDAPAAIAAPSR